MKKPKLFSREDKVNLTILYRLKIVLVDEFGRISAEKSEALMVKFQSMIIFILRNWGPCVDIVFRHVSKAGVNRKKYGLCRKREIGLKMMVPILKFADSKSCRF